MLVLIINDNDVFVIMVFPIDAAAVQKGAFHASVFWMDGGAVRRHCGGQRRRRQSNTVISAAADAWIAVT